MPEIDPEALAVAMRARFIEDGVMTNTPEAAGEAATAFCESLAAVIAEFCAPVEE